MNAYHDQIQQAASFLRERGANPSTLVVLGTGLGGVSDRLEEKRAVSYEDIPHFPRSTSPGHSGQLVFGILGGRQVMAMEGRFHLYESYSMREITLPIRVARALGADELIVTSAVGGMNPQYTLGEVVAIEDHISLLGDSPLRGPNDERLGPRFPDMSAPYDPAFLDRLETTAHAAGFRLPRAVLVSVPGPQLETRAEYRYLRTIGADVVGMSTVPEVIAGVHGGMRVAALSVVTDLCFPDSLEAVDIDRIIATANAAAPRLEQLILGLLEDDTQDA